MLLASCGGDKGEATPRTLADYKDITAADSLLYYFGQMQAQRYWSRAGQDSTLGSRESRDEYMRGLRAGLEAARESSEAYNLGLNDGVQLALNMSQFKKEYDVALNREIILNSVADGLMNDSAVDAHGMQREFRNILERFAKEKEEREASASRDALAQAAKTGKWTKITDNIYAGEGTDGTGAPVKKGERISLTVQVSTLDGRELDRQTRDDMKVGEYFSGPVTDALETMKLGGDRTFYTSGSALFGRFMERYRVKPTDVLVVKLAPGAPKAAADSAE